ncbi:MAG TPA: hypothetical protein VN669_08775 [Candidatus Acidoferrales bacterium]|nr:hypothetical protein [Candidatus Acidoferrales bacterium]
MVEFPLVAVPVHWTGKLLVICEQSADAIEAVVDPWLLTVLTVTPFTVNERELRPQTSVQVCVAAEQFGNNSSPPVITAVPLTVWAEAEPTHAVINNAASISNTPLALILSLLGL